ncbi:haloacid dehalogenase type II [Polynucleobacter victoriensis]|uniref:(S)-2-haloacid dehalogenase n=1 Tax=Polynucleobacter victoriensis TaxID=2049319 RepID=A0A212T3E7_9BURK|nr:haloacid dehalogenase type II [Polynucleobacter victoriensis]SNC60568.1 2-haloacid dehalogenase [Polynucleobacter victoriensis]
MNSPIKVIAFDVFGTTVDWHGSIMQEIQQMGLNIDADQFANAWRSGYEPAMAEVRKGAKTWTKIDVLHRMILDKILDDFKITHLSEEQKVHLNLIWHRLHPWADTVEGLLLLKRRFKIVTLSNGNLGLLANMAKFGGLPWDLILSAEVFRHYKPDPETYLGVADIFDVQPHEVMLVATHTNDLKAAKSYGLKTAYVHRALEFGANQIKPIPDVSDFDLSAADFIDLAKKLV